MGPASRRSFPCRTGGTPVPPTRQLNGGGPLAQLLGRQPGLRGHPLQGRLGVAGGLFYFTVSDHGGVTWLWRSDGTSEGTIPLRNLFTVDWGSANGAQVFDPREVNGTFYFSTAPGLFDPRTLYKPADFDFQLRPGSSAVDAGVRLPGVNDDFTGRAPDLGALEVGRPAPHYGPRE